MRKDLKIETTTKKNLWIKFVNDNRFKQGIQELTLDFSSCQFIEPFHIVLLACLIEEYFQNGVVITFRIGDNHALNEYLANIQFWGYWNPGVDRSSFRQTSKITNLCLWKFVPTRLSPYVDYAKRYFEDNYLKDKSFDPLYICLAELFNNIVDHSKSPVSGFTTSQFYPRLNKLRIAVCDFGTGIPTAVNTFLSAANKSQIQESAALEWAFQKGFSTKSTPQNRGFGLDNLWAIVKSCNGTLRVVSNAAMMISDVEGTKFFALKHCFIGSHFEVVLDTSTFEEREEEILSADFSF